MKRFTLNIKGKEHGVTINTLCQRRYAEKIGLKYVNEVIDSLRVEVNDEGKPVTSFEVLDRFSQLIHCGIEEDCRQQGTKTELTAEDCYTIFDDDNAAEMKKALEGIFGTLPVPDEEEKDEGNPKSPGEIPG